MTVRVCVAAVALLAVPASATTLTFDIAGLTNSSFVPQAYGDRVTSTTDGDFGYLLDGGATPNVEVSYEGVPGGELSWWSAGFSDLENVAYFEPESANGFSITLTADPGWLVDLRGFDIGNFGSTRTIGVSIETGAGGVLDSTPALPVPGAGNPHVSYNPAGPVVSGTVVIRIDTTGLGGSSDNIGLDNITFTQVRIPAPGSLALAGLAGAGLIRRRR